MRGAVPFFDSKGNRVSGAKIGKGGTGDVESEVAAAVARCRTGGSARDEMAVLLQRYPHLKEERWEEGEHPLSPLVSEYVAQIMR